MTKLRMLAMVSLLAGSLSTIGGVAAASVSDDAGNDRSGLVIVTDGAGLGSMAQANGADDAADEPDVDQPEVEAPDAPDVDQPEDETVDNRRGRGQG